VKPVKRDETFDVGGPASIDVDIRSGQVEIRTGAVGRISVSLDGDDIGEWDIDQLGDAITVRPASRRTWRHRSIRILAIVPVGTDIDVDSASADVTLAGELGTTRLRSASGDVRVDGVVRLDVNTASGEMRVNHVRTDATCSTASGDIEIGEVGGRLNASSASGGIRVTSAADDMQISTASGDVRVGCCRGSVVSIKAISGDVRLGLPAGIRVEPEISTLSGQTSLATPSSQPTVDNPRRVRVRLRSVSGDIASTASTLDDGVIGPIGLARGRTPVRTTARLLVMARRGHVRRRNGREQQRVAIARALANRPRLLLADERRDNWNHGPVQRSSSCW